MNTSVEAAKPAIEVKSLNFWYPKQREKVLHDVTVSIQKSKITAIMGPSGCGKSTLLRCMNRIHDIYPGCRYQGQIILQPDNLEILSSRTDLYLVRQQIGMVFQQANLFPKTIYENVAYGLRVNGIKDKQLLDASVEESLRQSALWDEVKDRLHTHAGNLSGGQKQRLCIARAIVVQPQVLLLDEPCSALDPNATGRIEELLVNLKDRYTVVIVTHNREQAGRVSDFIAFMYLGELIEFNASASIIGNPKTKLVQDFLTKNY
ncbi:MAG: phosphate ABC transporter ATP-binding protein [Patescibacteria group bacterium]